MTGVADTVRRFWPVALLVWVVVGTIAVSPITLASLLALILVVAVSCRGICGVERRIIVFVILLAVLLRALAIFGLLLSSDPGQIVSFPFETDGRFLKQRALWMRSLWLGVPIEAEQLEWTFQSYGWTSYIYLLGYMQYLFGPAPYAIHFFNGCCFVGGMVILHRIVRQAFGALAGIVALVVTLFLPTLFMWSISALKESLYLLLLSAALLAALQIVRGPTARARVTAAAGLVVTTAALDSVRSGGLIIVLTAGAIALTGTFVARRTYILALTLVLVPVFGWQLTRVPAIRERLVSELQLAASRHVGHVRTTGNGYKVLDQRFYSGDSLTSMTANEARRFAVRAPLSVVVVPLPWQLGSRSELLFLPQQLIWYGLVFLALVGAAQGMRGDAFVTWCLVGVSCAGVAAVASSSGNIGTMVRHRDGVVPFVACLSAAGVVSLLQWAGLFRKAPRSSDVVMRETRFSANATPKIGALLSGVVPSRLRQLGCDSIVCGAVSTLLRPTIGYGQNTAESRGYPEGDELQVDDVLMRVGESSVLVSTIRCSLASVRHTWDQTAVARALATIGRLDLADRLRLSGVLLFLGTLGHVALSAGDRVWPIVVFRVVTLACAVGLAGGGRQLATAWKDCRRAAIGG